MNYLHLTRIFSEQESSTVKIKINCGGGWEGHVFYRAVDPNNEDNYITTNRLNDVESFAQKNGLKMDEGFKSLVLKKLTHSQDGFIVPPQFIDENLPISSCSQYIKDHFKGYY